MTGKEWAGLGIGAGGGLAALFGSGSDSTAPTIDQLNKLTESLTAQGKSLGVEGEGLLGPVSQYLKDLVGGDRQAVLQATLPERRRVIDQYSTAKRAIAEFAPRGGGQATAMSDIEARKASDLAAIGASARTQGVNQAERLGSDLSRFGLEAQGAASSNLSRVLQAQLEQDRQKAEGWSGLGAALGTLAGFFL